MAHRDFDAAVDEVLKNRPVFTLGGREWTCKPRLSTAAFIEFQNAEPDEKDPFGVFRVFFSKVLVKADREPFMTLIENDEDEDDFIPIGLGQLNELVKWLVETYTGFPTPNAEPSTTTPETTGQPLKVLSFAPVVEGEVVVDEAANS